jgi:hypothetical protein
MWRQIMKIFRINIKKVLIPVLVAFVAILVVFFSIPLNPPEPVEACGFYGSGGGNQHGGNQQGGGQQGGGQQGGGQQGGGQHGGGQHGGGQHGGGRH